MPAPSIPNTLSPHRRAAIVYEYLRSFQEDEMRVELARVAAAAKPGDVMAAFADTDSPLTYQQQGEAIKKQQQELASAYSNIWDDVLAVAAERAEAEQPED